MEEKEFDAFLCYNSKDKPSVKHIAEQLRSRGFQPWFDEWELQPGMAWQRALEHQIENINAAAVFVGKSGLGPWQEVEQDAFLREFARRVCPVIPVILPDCDTTPSLPIFLQGMTWVDFRKSDPEPIEQLIWGITGKRQFTSDDDNAIIAVELTGPEVRYLRKFLGLSQVALAHLSGISPTVISQHERGRKKASSEDVQSLIDALRRHPRYKRLPSLLD